MLEEIKKLLSKFMTTKKDKVTKNYISNLYEIYVDGGMKWKLQIIKFGIKNPERLVADDKLWEEFITYSIDCELYPFKVTKNTDRLMAVKTVEINYNLVIKDKYEY